MTSPVPAPEHPPVRTADGKLGADIPAADPPQRERDLDRIYDALAHGRGREWVDDGNVDALVAMAQRAGNRQLELLLREWRSPCGEAPPPCSSRPPCPHRAARATERLGSRPAVGHADSGHGASAAGSMAGP